MDEPETILTVDIGRKSTGLAFGPPGRLPVLSHVSIANWENSTTGEQARAGMIWINDALNIYEPDLLVIEAALVANRQGNDNYARFALGMAFLVAGACALRGVGYVEVANNTWKAYSLGNGRLPSADAKILSLKVARQMDLTPANHDEADAANIHFWASHKFAGKQNNVILPIFAAARMRAQT